MRKLQVMGKKIAAAMVVLCLILGTLTGCGDGIKEETAAAVKEKTSQALELYADIEKTVKEHELTADKAFTDMKEQLTGMSAKVNAEVEKTTEEDGQQTMKELDRIIQNLQEVKEKVEKSIEEVTK